MENNKKIAVYGSLRNGEYNCVRFQNYFPNQLEYQKTVTILGYDLFDLGSYPGIKVSEDPNKELVVDLFNCSEPCFKTIDGMEKGANYSSKTITINGEEYTIYIYNGRTNTLVESGDWSKYLSHEQAVKLNEGWIVMAKNKVFTIQHNNQKFYPKDHYLEGASDFLNLVIKELTKQLNETSDIGDYNQGIRRGLLRAIINIKNIKP